MHRFYNGDTVRITYTFSDNDQLTPDQTVGGVTLTKNQDKCISCQNDKTQGSAKFQKDG